MEKEIEILLKWNQEILKICISEDSTIEDLKNKITQKTNIEMGNQKIIITGKSNFENNRTIKSYNFKKSTKGVLIGKESNKIENFKSLESKILEEENEKKRLKEIQQRIHFQQMEQQRLELEEERKRRDEEMRQREEERRNQRLIEEMKNVNFFFFITFFLFNFFFYCLL